MLKALRCASIMVATFIFETNYAIANSEGTCKTSVRMESFDKLADIKGVNDELSRQGIHIAESTARYQKYDVEDKNSSKRQFIVGFSNKDFSIIWYRSAGFVEMEHGIAFRRVKGENGLYSMKMIGGVNYSGPICEATNAILAGVRSHGGNF